MRSIDPFLLNKIKLQQQTMGNNADPNMRVSIARARSTVVDSSYWTTETIRQGTNLGDVAVAARRQRVTGPPNKLFEIHIQDGEVSTATRMYPDRLKDGWRNEFSIGPGLSVAIAFNGNWKRHRSVWRLVTSEKPLISWISNSGILQSQIWDEEETRITLADNARFVRMLRGWKNLEAIDRDQGVIAAYIKQDGGVYYRNYCEGADGVHAWEPERQLIEFEGTAKTLNLFITNDYRVGFVIEDNTGTISWYITCRNWAGMASPAENIRSAITNITLDVIPVDYHETKEEEHISAGISDIDFQVCPASVDISNAVIKATRLNPTEFLVEFRYRLSGVVDSDGFAVDNYSIIHTRYGQNSKEIILTVDRATSEIGVFTIRYSEGEIRAEITDICKALLPSFVVVAVGEPPEIEERINAGIEDIQVEVKKVFYSGISIDDEHIGTSIADLNITITKVGNNPL